jgi:RHS repeat-associated protein
MARLLRETDAAGKVTLFINPAYVITRDGGASTVTKYLLDDRGTVASIVHDGPGKTILYYRRDFKGSNTHAFGSGGAVVTRLAYSGYGRPLVMTGTNEIRPKYEQREWDADLGIYCFGARFYDAFTGRFLTPDSRTGADDLFRLDVLNRFAFELNNPINNVDPTGNSVGDMIGGILIGIALVASAVATVATFGAATPLLAMSVGALVGAGLTGIAYSTTHADASGGRFWGGYMANAAVGAVIGAATAGAASAIGGAIESATVSLTGRAAITAARAGLYAVSGSPIASAADTFSQFMSNVIDQKILNKEGVSLGDGLGRAAITGAIMGAMAGVGQAAAEYRYLKLTATWGESEGFRVTAYTSSNREAALIQSRAQRVWEVEPALKSQAALFGIAITVDIGLDTAAAYV